MLLQNKGNSDSINRLLLLKFCVVLGRPSVEMVYFFNLVKRFKCVETARKYDDTKLHFEVFSKKAALKQLQNLEVNTCGGSSSSLKLLVAGLLKNTCGGSSFQLKLLVAGLLKYT